MNKVNKLIRLKAKLSQWAWRELKANPPSECLRIIAKYAHEYRRLCR